MQNVATPITNLVAGLAAPIGATVYEGGVNFSLYSKNGLAVELLLFNDKDDIQPAITIPLDNRRNKTYHYWHVFVGNVKPGQLYAWRVQGPFDPCNGHRFDASKMLLDPYSKAICLPDAWNRNAFSGKDTPTIPCMKSVVAEMATYNWEGDQPLRRPFGKTIIYELHVGGFTKHPSSGVADNKRGTYAGLIEKIPYLADLGITAVELLPVFQFDVQDCPEGKVNYWGYSPISFFAPHLAYSSNKDPLKALDEFRDMVKALHRAGIEVILDVVFNHTSEGNQDGPTYCFRGIDNSIYYILEQDKQHYSNFSGTGNTLNANQPIVRRMILDSIHYWVQQMHVDGFRFDLASILSRDENGKPLENAPVLWDIESDPHLAGVKLIAEAWDAAGLYQVGTFVGDSWKEWNGRFRDDVRSFIKGDNNVISRLASRLLGSPDIYGHEDREPEQSINFVTCHDGFTINDLVSYNYKHNEANGEDNRDGGNDNLSWNCGVEGDTDDPEIEALRNRRVKNLLALTIVSIGTPMLLMGDEVRRTQHGNNNAYCQDNEISWFDWSYLQKHADVHRFVKLLNRIRLQRDASNEAYSTTLNELLRNAVLHWHGTKLNAPDWGHTSRSIAVSIQSLSGNMLIHYMINAYSEDLEFELPRGEQQLYKWQRWMDTSLPAPNDIQLWPDAPFYEKDTYRVKAFSIVFLFAHLHHHAT